MLQATFVHRVHDSYKQDFLYPLASPRQWSRRVIHSSWKQLYCTSKIRLSFFYERHIKKEVIWLHATARKHLQLRVQIQRNFLQIVPLTEETVYNSDRHVAIMILFARSDTHAIEEVTFLFNNSLGRARVNNASSNARTQSPWLL